jgi:hypothetical protein
LLRGKAEFYFDVEFLKAVHKVNVLHLLPVGRIVIVVITPLAEAHLLADEIHGIRWPLAGRYTLAAVVNRDRGLMGG